MQEVWSAFTMTVVVAAVEMVRLEGDREAERPLLPLPLKKLLTAKAIVPGGRVTLQGDEMIVLLSKGDEDNHKGSRLHQKAILLTTIIETHAGNLLDGIPNGKSFDRVSEGKVVSG